MNSEAQTHSSEKPTRKNSAVPYQSEVNESAYTYDLQGATKEIDRLASEISSKVLDSLRLTQPEETRLLATVAGFADPELQTMNGDTSKRMIADIMFSIQEVLKANSMPSQIYTSPKEFSPKPGTQIADTDSYQDALKKTETGTLNIYLTKLEQQQGIVKTMFSKMRRAFFPQTPL